MAIEERNTDGHIAAEPVEATAPVDAPLSEKYVIEEEKLAGAHVLDVDVANITGDIPLHPQPRGDNDAYDDLKDELETKIDVIDWYKPFPLIPGAREEEHILTIRAIVVGIALGSLTICSNVYLGIRSCSKSHGWV